MGEISHLIKGAQWGPCLEKVGHHSCFAYKICISAPKSLKGGRSWNSLFFCGHWANPCGEVWSGHILTSHWHRGGGGFWLSPQLYPSLGHSLVWWHGAPYIPRLPPPSYCQSSSPGKGEFSDNNVLVDWTKRVGQSTSVTHLTPQARYPITHMVTSVMPAAPRWWVRPEPQQCVTISQICQETYFWCGTGLHGHSGHF